MRLVALLILAPLYLIAQKATIAVGPFEVPSDVQYRYDFNGTGLRETLPALLEGALFETDQFNIVERARLDVIMDEQMLSYAGITDGALDFGKLKGVDCFVIGRISGYSADVDNVRVNVGIKTMYVNNQNVRITLTVKLVSVTTGQILGIITDDATVTHKGRPRANQSNQIDHTLIDDAAREVARKVAVGIKDKYLASQRLSGQ